MSHSMSWDRYGRLGMGRQYVTVSGSRIVSVKVSNCAGAGNGHFCDLQTTTNGVKKAGKNFIFYRKCNPKSLLTATTLVGPRIKHGVLGGYSLKKQ